jgi:hypothetical protein
MIKKQWQMAIDHIEQFRGIVNGDSYSDIEWNGTPISEEDLIAKYEEVKRGFWTIELIEKRNKLLSECDWTQNRDVSLHNDAEWAEYRQALRDITDNFDPFVEEVVWPEKPL